MKRSIIPAPTALSLGAALPAMAACTDTARMKVDWKECDLGAINLSDPNLSDANLNRANLTGAQNAHVDLRDANLTGANFKRCGPDLRKPDQR